jgi:lysosomal acid lipase/cholesteryl ester hydrolase
MGFYDVPAMTSLILKETGHPHLSYVGHSMGTTMFWVFCATHPGLQSRIRQMHALAPVAFMSRLKSPIRKVAPFARLLQVRLCAILYNSAAN